MAKHDVEFRVRVTQRGDKGFVDVERKAARAQRATDKLNRTLEETGEVGEESGRRLRASAGAMEGLGATAETVMRKLRGVGVAIAGAAVTRVLVEQGKAAVGAASQMEQYAATVENMLGSSAAARDRMAEYLDIAKITPFDLTAVVEGGNQLQALGRYSRQTLVMLGDLAAASGKPLEQVMDAYSKVATGQKGAAMRQFRDLLISSQDWMEATGKGMGKGGDLLASTEEMLNALPKIMDKKGFSGLMAKQSETTAGKLSNLEDAVFSLRAAVGERLTPAVKSVTGWLGKMADGAERSIKIPLAEKIGREKAELNLMVTELIKANEELGRGNLAEERRSTLIGEITRKYPEFIRGLDLETSGVEALQAALVKANEEYDERIRKAAIAHRLERLQQQSAEAYEDYLEIELSRSARERNAEIRRQYGRVGQLQQDDAGRLYYNEQERNGGIYHKRRYLGDEEAGWVRPLWEEYKANQSFTKLFDSERRLNKKMASYQQIKGQEEAINRLLGGATSEEEERASSSGGTRGGEVVDDETLTGGGLTAGSGSSGGGGVRSVTTNIGTLVGTIEIHTVNMTEGAAEIKRLVAQALTEAIPD